MSNAETSQRTLDELEAAVDYLLGYIFAHQRNSKNVKRNPLGVTVNFMQDRIRAIQVDLTTLLGHDSIFDADTRRKVRSIEAKLIRFNVLSQYLLSDLDHNKVQWKFMNTALRTAVSAYFATWNRAHESASDEEIADRDEIISYTALLHISTVLRRRETEIPPPLPNVPWCGIVCEDGEGMSGLLGLQRRYMEQELTDEEKADNAKYMEKYPKWSWALKVASAAENGDYFILLRLMASHNTLVDMKELDGLSAADKETKLKIPLDDETRWKILARCCMAQILPVVRLGQTRLYNKSLGKEEKVSGENLAQLLYLPNARSAITFCAKIGLPTSSDDSPDDHVVMNSALLSIKDDIAMKTLANPGRNEDLYVFGSYASLFLTNEEIDSFEEEKVSETPLGLMLNFDRQRSNGSLAKAQSCLDDSSMESFELDFEEYKEEPGFWGSLRPRVDIDRVKVLPSVTMWELVG